MNLLYKKTPEGLTLQRCYTLDGIVQIPDRIEGGYVTELDRYTFSETVRGRDIPPKMYAGEPELCGTGLEELVLPEHVKKVGAYAFYNCFNLKSLSCSSTVEDWGAGVFTGCTGIKKLDIRIVSGRKSCFKEILSELRQTLEVVYRDEDGEVTARLIFPEYFEESIENTPARIIMREMHGCGHMYRYCFDNTVFQFREYDLLFPEVKISEKPQLVTQLALYRLYWPQGLTPEAEAAYWDYLKQYPAQAAEGVINRRELPLLEWMAKAPQADEPMLEEMLKAGGRLKNPGASAILLDTAHSRFGGGSAGSKPQSGTPAPRRRTFEL